VSAKSLRISGTLRASNFKQGSFTLAVVYPSRLSITIVRGKTEEQVIAVPAGTFLMANLAYWDSKTAQATAQQYANRWLMLPGPTGATLARKFEVLLKGLRSCSRGSRTEVSPARPPDSRTRHSSEP
jgi:hypothetical protein